MIKHRISLKLRRCATSTPQGTCRRKLPVALTGIEPAPPPTSHGDSRSNCSFRSSADGAPCPRQTLIALFSPAWSSWSFTLK